MPRGDMKAQSILRPVTTSKVVPKVWSYGLRNVQNVAAAESENQVIHIPGVVQLMQKPDNMSRLSLQLKFPQVTELHSSEGLVATIRDCKPKKSDFSKGRVGGKYGKQLGCGWSG